jgi:hypothetical protein
MLLMGAYYTNFAYIMWTNSAAAASFFVATNFIFMIGLLVLPPIMAFVFTGYLRPARGKAKMTMLGPSVVLGIIYVSIALTISANIPILGNLIILSGWGIGSAILTAGGFSIAQSYEQSTTPGMLDVSSLHYGPPKEEEEEPESVTEVSESTEATEETGQHQNGSGDSDPAESVSE